MLSLGSRSDSSDQNLLMEIVIEQERFEVALSTVELRSEFVVSEFQPELSKIGIEKGVKIHGEELHLRLGTRIHRTTVHYTDQMYKHVYETHESTLAVLNKFTAYAKRTFPGKRFIKIADPDDPAMTVAEERICTQECTHSKD